MSSWPQSTHRARKDQESVAGQQQDVLAAGVANWVECRKEDEEGKTEHHPLGLATRRSPQ